MRLSRAVVPAVVAATLVLTGCSNDAVPTPDRSPTQSATATADVRTIISTVVVDGVVEANPVISVFAPVDGVIEMRPNTATTLLAGAAIGSAGGVEIVVPADGMLIEQLRKTGDSVAANTPIASVAYSGHGVRIVVPPEQLFRLYQEPVYGKVNIIAGPAGLDCVLAPAVTVAADEPAGVICLLPREAEVVPGLSAKVGINTGQRDSVVALPVSAVSGSSNQGEVTIVRGNERIRTSVTLGISDGAFIEILEGVAVGDKVLSFAPKLG